ncbi:uncharacterized protein [Argopecten irradians]|uniref:uncharacterized protein n=1 Tax=Argopecten irradians TaxID=31199 RepID=UPI003711CC65
MAAQVPVEGCVYHSRNSFVYVCETCNNELICIDCVIDRHYKHDLGKLKDYMTEQTKQIKQYEEQLSKVDIPKLENDIKENEEDFQQSSKEFEEMIDEIKRQGDQMKKEIDKFIDRLVKLCRDLEKMNEEITEKNNVQLRKCYDEMVPRLDRYRQVLTQGTLVDVIKLAKETRDTDYISPVLGTQGAFKTAAFEPGTIDTRILEGMLGTMIVDGYMTPLRATAKTSTVQKLEKTLSCTVCRPCSSGVGFWLSFWREEKVSRVDQKGNTVVTINCKAEVRSIAVSPTTGRVWFCVRGDKSIREITSNGKIVTRFNAESFPRCLCITRDDMAVVGTNDGILLYPPDGQMVTDEADRVCKQEAVVAAHHMSYCVTSGDVVAADNDGVTFSSYIDGKEPSAQPKVIVMDRDLKIKFQCRHIDVTGGPAEETQKAKFYSDDVCFDEAGDVLVLERVSKSVHLIDGNNGNFLRTVYTSDGTPWCIGLQSDGTLWIGKGRKTEIVQCK